jgi:ubiquinone/menaquinone biosynthesis C-methylase UbiE
VNRPGTPPFANHFGPQAEQYVEYRPHYPAALFHYLAVAAGGTRLAWDCATGNGQAAVGLAERFGRVVATDASADMIARAKPHARVTYHVTMYESGLPDRSANLVTVAQALHWLDLEALMREVRRVLVHDGLFAAWCYPLCRIEPRVDEVVDLFYQLTLGPFWPPERRHTEDGYRSLVLPIAEMPAPPLEMKEDWSMPQFLQYVSTWSGVRQCIAARGEAPFQAFQEAIRERWGNPMLRRAVRWPLLFRLGRVR